MFQNRIYRYQIIIHKYIYIYTYTHNFIDSLDRYYIDIDIASIRTIQIDIRYRYRYIDIDSILTLFE